MSGAGADGQTTFPGRPCWKGHAGLRYRCNNQCVVCSREKTAAYGRSLEGQEKRRIYRDQNKERIDARTMAWAKSSRGLDKLFRRRYGVGYDEVLKVKNSQQGLCAICADPLTEGKNGMHLDHCHKTNKFRGLLCSPCNLGLGKFRDNPAFLRSAASYVETNKEIAK